jgi:hypothetical protein
MFCFKASVLFRGIAIYSRGLCQIKNSMGEQQEGNFRLGTFIRYPSVSIMPLWNDQKKSKWYRHNLNGLI